MNSDKNIELTSQGDIILAAAGRIFNFPVTGFAVSSGSDVTFEAPGGVGITEGSLHVIGDCNIGTGFTGMIVAGGIWLDFQNGIIIGGGPSR